MVDDGQFAKNADIQARAGQNANTTSKATAATDVYVQDIEAYINSITKFDWTAADTTSTFDASIRGILIEAAASLCAMKVINDDMSGFTSRAEAQTMIDINFDAANRAIKELKEIDIQDFITGV